MVTASGPFHLVSPKRGRCFTLRDVLRVAFLKGRTLSFVLSTLAFSRRLRLSTLHPEPNEPRFAALLNDDSVRLTARMVRRANGLIEALKRMPATLDLCHGYRFLL